MTTQPTTPDFPAARMAVTLTVVAVVGFGVAAGVVSWLGHHGHVIIAGLTALGVVVGSLCSIELIRRAARADLGRVASACMGGMTVRLGISVVAAVLIFTLLGAPRQSVALWTMAWYLVLLITEVVMLLGFFRRLRGPGTPPDTLSSSSLAEVSS